MYYFEKDYIMRLIHGIARILARMLFEKDLEEDGELAAVMEQDCAETYDYLRAMIDAGQINEAEEKLFDLLGQETGYEYLVLDLGDGLGLLRDFLESCDRIFMPAAEDIPEKVRIFIHPQHILFRMEQ